MSTSLIESLVSAGQALSGNIFRVIAGKREDTGNATPLLLDNLGQVNVVPGVGSSDAFSRFRTADPQSILDIKQVNDNAPLLMDTSLVGGGTSTFSANIASSNMTLTTANGDSVVRQSKMYVPYQANKSQLILVSGVMGALKTNVRQRIGYFDANNGLFFQQDGTNLSVVRRSFVTGAAVDTVVNQSAWNIDKLDGTGTSGITVTMSNIQTFVIDFSWGAGVGRLGFLFTENTGSTRIVYCHQFTSGNTLTTVLMTTGSLPLRWEITNTGVAASGTTMVQTGGGVLSEGGFDDLGVVVSTSNTASVTIAARAPLLSIRLKTGFTRGLIIPLDFTTVTSNGSVYLAQVVIGGTLTGASFNATTGAASEFDVAATAISGGVVVGSSFTSANGTRQTQDDITNGLVAAANIAGTTDIVSIVITPLATNPTIWGALNWREIY